ncbi:TAXI family TRAP transporter solute-binding subunit [Methylobacterium sp. M6A4_1b]
MRPFLKIVAVVGVLFALAAAGAYILMRYPALISARYTLTLATGPVASDGQKVLAAFIRDLASEHPLIRLVPVPMDSVHESGRALAEGRVDLAVVRSDDEAAANGRTLFVLRQDGIAIIIPPDAKIETVSALAGKTLAVAKGSDPGLLKALREFFDLREADLIAMPAAEIGPSLKARRAVAAVVSGPLGPGPIPDAFAGIRKTYKAKPSYLDIPESDAIAARSPSYKSVEIKQGTYGGTPTEPDESIHSFAVRTLLVSRASLPDRVAGEITRLLLTTKAKVVATLPAAGQMEAPETERSSLLPVHHGTLAYLNGEQESLLDQTVNYYWLSVMIFAILAPAVGWIASRRQLRRNREQKAKLRRVVELVRLAKVGSAAQIAYADAELEAMSEWLLTRLVAGEIERDHFHFLERMISGLRATIENRLARSEGASLRDRVTILDADREKR